MVLELMAMASPMPDMAMEPTPMLDMAMEPTPMPTMERGLLMLSLRPMLMLTTMELMVLAMAMASPMPDMAMLLPMPTTERGLLMLSLRLMLLFSTELTVLAMAMAMLLPTP